MNVAIVAPWAVKCGIYTYTRDLSEALAEKGVDIYIIRLPRFGRKTHAIFGQVVNKIPVKDIDLINVQHEYGLYNGLDEAFYGGLKRLGKPIVSTMHAVGNVTIDRAIADASDRVIVHNEFCKKRFRFKSEVIHHGCKPSKTVPRDEAMKKLGIDPRIPTVGYCGFIGAAKGLETLIEAVSKIPKSALLIGGGWHTEPGTAYIAGLNQMTQRLLPHRCKWLGFVPDDELPMAYGGMSLVIYPSIYATESGALLMALSHGKATIASRIGPFRSKEKEGALITFRGVKDLTRKIKKVLKDDELRGKLEEGARKYAFENRWERIAERHIELYSELLNGTG
ncbi:glycosyltransferase [Patescibacteria group bacterium]|uniref:Putative glycosyltransferase n=1 Tax=viral metagenome TaxID=1070528 RepID=A0A6M3M4S2_9ZZZZ|nr:glycosyltransferase [Patescibacteria group bacterium]